MVEAQVFEMVTTALGPAVGLAVVLYMYAIKTRPEKDDTVDRLFSRMDAMNDTLNDVRDRVSRLEGKVSK